MDVKKQRVKASPEYKIGIIPFFNDYRTFLNLKYEASLRHKRLTAFVVEILEQRLKRDTGNDDYKVTSGELLHRAIKEVTKTSVSDYIEESCFEALGFMAKKDVKEVNQPVKKAGWLDSLDLNKGVKR